ncbi:MAG: DUF4852 domain-containing protein [Acidobacteriota bacterium]
MLLFAAAGGLANQSSHKRSSTPRSSTQATTKPISHASQQTPLAPMSKEEAFFYYCALFGSPSDVIDRYGKYFDASNYAEAMADEFQRAQYRERLSAKIAKKISSLNFAKKFMFVGSTAHEGYTSLGEYSFDSHSFPVRNMPTIGFCLDAGRTFFGNCTGTVLHLDIFKREDAVNEDDVTWLLPMSEQQAKAFVKSRAGAERRVAARVVYSVLPLKGTAGNDTSGRASTLRTVIHSVEIFDDDTLTTKLGSLPIRASAGPVTSADWQKAAQDATSATETIGTYRSISSYRDNMYRRPDTPINGTITLTNVGLSLSGEQPDGTAKPLTLAFTDLFAATLEHYEGRRANAVMRLVRANYDGGSKDYKDFRVVLAPYWRDDHRTQLVFPDLAERDRFFRDLTGTLQAWSARSTALATAKLEIDERCLLVSGYLVQCSESHPFEIPR